MKNYRKLIALLLALIMIFASVTECFAATTTKAKNLTLSAKSGTVTITNASGKKQNVKDDMRLYSGYTIKTGKKSYATISLDDSKAIKLDALSEVEIRKSGKKLEIYLVDGSLFCNVDKKLKNDETLNIRTNTMITGIRGTSVQFDKSDDSFAAKFFDGYGESVNMSTGQNFTVDAGSKLALDDVNVTANAESTVEMTDIISEMSASAAEEVMNNPELSARIAETFNVTADELVSEISANISEMQARDEKQQEEKEAKAAEAAKSEASSISKLVETATAANDSSSQTSAADYSYYGQTVSQNNNPTDNNCYVTIPYDKTGIASYEASCSSISCNGRTYTVAKGSTFGLTVRTTDASVVLSPAMTCISSDAGIAYYETTVTTNVNISAKEYSTRNNVHNDSIAISNAVEYSYGDEFLGDLNINETGVVTIATGASITIHAQLNNSGIIYNNGTIIVEGGATLNNNTGAKIINASGASITNKAHGKIINNGLITATNFVQSKTIVKGAGSYICNNKYTVYYIETTGTSISRSESSKEVSLSTFVSDMLKVSVFNDISNLNNYYTTYTQGNIATPNYIKQITLDNDTITYHGLTYTTNGLVLNIINPTNPFADSIIWLVPNWQ